MGGLQPPLRQKTSGRKGLKKASPAEMPGPPSGDTTADEEKGEVGVLVSTPRVVNHDKEIFDVGVQGVLSSTGKAAPQPTNTQVPTTNGDALLKVPSNKLPSRQLLPCEPSVKKEKTVNFDDLKRCSSESCKIYAQRKTQAKDDVGAVVSKNTSQSWHVTRRSTTADKYNASESDLLFITYASTIFDKHDRGSGQLGPRDLRMSLRFFNVYMSSLQAQAVMCMFLRDKQEFTPEDESLATMNFCQFTRLLLQVEEYMLSENIRRMGLFGLVDSFLACSPSKRIDVTFRVAWPLLNLFHVALFYCLLRTDIYGRYSGD